MVSDVNDLKFKIYIGFYAYDRVCVPFVRRNAEFTPCHNYCISEMTTCDALLGAVHTFGLGTTAHRAYESEAVKW